MRIFLLILALFMVSGCGKQEGVKTSSSEPFRLSEEDVEKLSPADLDNPNINIHLTPEQRKSILSKGSSR